MQTNEHEIVNNDNNEIESHKEQVLISNKRKKKEKTEEKNAWHYSLIWKSIGVRCIEPGWMQNIHNTHM